MHKQVIRVGGVPEHYNLPWTLAAERDIFSRESIDLVWTMYAGGTGAMTAALERDELDVAILLTEGFVAAAANGLQAKIVKVSIDTPLYGCKFRPTYTRIRHHFANSHFPFWKWFAYHADDSCASYSPNIPA